MTQGDRLFYGLIFLAVMVIALLGAAVFPPEGWASRACLVIAMLLLLFATLYSVATVIERSPPQS